MTITLVDKITDTDVCWIGSESQVRKKLISHPLIRLWLEEEGDCDSSIYDAPLHTIVAVILQNKDSDALFLVEE